MLGLLPAGQVRHGAGRAPGGHVLLSLDWLPTLDRARARRVGVAGFLWGWGPFPCGGVRCRGVVWAWCPPPPCSWGWVWLRSRQVMPGVPASLWLFGVVLVVVGLPLRTQLLLGALWCAGPRWCRTASSPRGVCGALLVWCGDGCAGG